jgi:hypothetical protein
MLRIYNELAVRLYRQRWWLIAVTAAGFLLLPAAFLTGSSTAFLIASALAGPVIATSWGLLLSCVWFHPMFGYLYTWPLLGRLPNIVKVSIRWYFVVFLTLWFLFGIVVWPVFAFWSTQLLGFSKAFGGNA